MDRVRRIWMGALWLTLGTMAAGVPHALAQDDVPGSITWVERARSAERLEDIGAYTKALELFELIRSAHPEDADLEYTMAVDEARLGKFKAAAARLWTPVMDEAAVDSLPVERHVMYFWGRESQWLNGKFDGWHWHILRARAEVAAALDDWDKAHSAARAAVEAHWHSGKDWQILGMTAAHTFRHPEAKRAFVQAAMLDPTLPEPFYMMGLYAWREGQRNEAQRMFREAIRRDSTWKAPALALVRSRLPAASPDSIPTWLLTGTREVSLVTSPVGPKFEQFVQMEQPAVLVKQGDVRFPPDMKLDRTPPPLVFPVFLDERGRALVHEFPWLPPGIVPEQWLGAIAASLPGWAFTPATKLGKPQRVWVNVEFKMPEQ